MPDLSDEKESIRKYLLLAILSAGMVFASIFATLRWTEFTGGNENLVVQTAIEMRRGGPWLVPQMMGEPRIAKPPLVAWITAICMKQSTLDQLSSADPAVREQAYNDLSLQVRWTGALAGGVANACGV